MWIYLHTGTCFVKYFVIYEMQFYCCPSSTCVWYVYVIMCIIFVPFSKIVTASCYTHILLSPGASMQYCAMPFLSEQVKLSRALNETPSQSYGA